MIYLEDRFEISELMDFYAPLLTEKQLNIMNMYFNDDLSLAEIAELNHTSRQAIHDSIKRCYKQLRSHEDKLRLKEKYFKRESLKENFIKNLKKNNTDNLSNELIEQINKSIEEIINI